MLYRSRFLPALVASSIIAATALGAVGVSTAAAKSTPKKGDTPADTKLFNKLLAISSPKLAVASAKNAAHAKNADKLGGLAPSAFQLRVSHSCTASNAIQAIASDGTVSCQPTGTGTVTGVSADTGLTGGGSSGNISLALDPNYRLPQGCSSNQLAKWTGTAWGCTDAPGGPPTGGAGGALSGNYPNPTLNVSGGPCGTGQFVTNVSTGAVLTCGPSGSNAALGSGALSSNTLGSNNSAVGLNALSSDTNDLGNTAVGDYALSSNTSGGGNTAVGHQALSSHTTGGGNTALGLNALYNGSAGVTSGASDTAIGNYAGTGLTTGSGNTLLGQYAGSSLSGGDSNNLDLGNAGVSGDNHTIRIGNQGTGSGAQNRAFVAGVSGVTPSGTPTPVLVDSNGQLGSATTSFTDASGPVDLFSGGCPTTPQNTWDNQSPNVNNKGGYYRDAGGIVHLRGMMRNCSAGSQTIFTLPAGYRPGRLEHQIADQDDSTFTVVTIDVSGNVNGNVTSDHSVSLDGLSYRCAPSGSNGCP